MRSGFISEADLAEKRRIRQENWERTRGADDPLEAPEEPADHRSLYDRLQEQKQKRQEEWEDAHRFKNIVRGLEDDEVDFLDFVDSTKMQQEKKIKEEEKHALSEYRKKVAEVEQKATESEVHAELRATENKKCEFTNSAKKNSQTALLAGAIKRKKTANDDNEVDSKSQKTTEGGSPGPPEECDQSYSVDQQSTRNVAVATSSGLQCVAILPGIGNYTNSSASEHDTDSDEELNTLTQSSLQRDITGKLIIKSHESSGSGKEYC